MYAFTIRPPYWFTWWFMLLVSLIVLAIAGSLVRYYYARKLEKQRMVLERKQALEKERTRIATDMHDDLGAGLSRIKFLSETIGMRKQQHLSIDDEISSIRLYAHEMIDKMGEIVWALNEKNDSLSDLLSYTRAYSMEYLAENGLQSLIDKLPPHGTIMVSSEFRRNIYLSVKETLHNVIKHAKASKVTIHFHIADKLVITIQDNGIGFDLEDIHRHGNGLINIRKRMIDIGGGFEVTKDHGTRIILTAPFPS
jgi:signal transduction histidine kinase